MKYTLEWPLINAKITATGIYGGTYLLLNDPIYMYEVPFIYSQQQGYGFYFQISAKVASGTAVVSLRRWNYSTDYATANVSATSFTEYSTQCSSAMTTDGDNGYVVYVSGTFTGLEITYAKIICIMDMQDLLYTQGGVIANLGGATSTAATSYTAMTNPKYFTCEEDRLGTEVSARLSIAISGNSTKVTGYAIVQKDDGSWSNWTDITESELSITFSAADTISCLYNTSFFDLEDGKHYRVAVKASSTKYTVTLHNANLTTYVRPFEKTSQTTNLFTGSDYQLAACFLNDNQYIVVIYVDGGTYYLGLLKNVSGTWTKVGTDVAMTYDNYNLHPARRSNWFAADYSDNSIKFYKVESDQITYVYTTPVYRSNERSSWNDDGTKFVWGSQINQTVYVFTRSGDSFSYTSFTLPTNWDWNNAAFNISGDGLVIAVVSTEPGNEPWLKIYENTSGTTWTLRTVSGTPYYSNSYGFLGVALNYDGSKIYVANYYTSSAYYNKWLNLLTKTSSTTWTVVSTLSDYVVHEAKNVGGQFLDIIADGDVLVSQSKSDHVTYGSKMYEVGSYYANYYHSMTDWDYTIGLRRMAIGTSNLYFYIVNIRQSALGKTEKRIEIMGVAESGTGLQNAKVTFDADDWFPSGAIKAYYYHNSNNASNSSKIYNLTDSADITNATVTGANEQVSSEFTLPTDEDQMDINVTNSTGVVASSGIIIVYDSYIAPTSVTLLRAEITVVAQTITIANVQPTIIYLDRAEITVFPIALTVQGELVKTIYLNRAEINVLPKNAIYTRAIFLNRAEINVTPNTINVIFIEVINLLRAEVSITPKNIMKSISGRTFTRLYSGSGNITMPDATYFAVPIGTNKLLENTFIVIRIASINSLSYGGANSATRIDLAGIDYLSLLELYYDGGSYMRELDHAWPINMTYRLNDKVGSSEIYFMYGDSSYEDLDIWCYIMAWQGTMIHCEWAIYSIDQAGEEIKCFDIPGFVATNSNPSQEIESFIYDSEVLIKDVLFSDYPSVPSGNTQTIETTRDFGDSINASQRGEFLSTDDREFGWTLSSDLYSLAGAIISYKPTTLAVPQITSGSSIFYDNEYIELLMKAYVSTQIEYVTDHQNDFHIQISDSEIIMEFDGKHVSQVQQKTKPSIGVSSSIRGATFKPDGTKLFTAEIYSNDYGLYIVEYNLSTAWDISTLTYVKKVEITFSEYAPECFYFKSDGTKFYIAGYQYNLSSAWDISTASLANTISPYYEFYSSSRAKDCFFNDDGTIYYYLNYLGSSFYTGNDAPYQRTVPTYLMYELSTAWDFSTSSLIAYIPACRTKYNNTFSYGQTQGKFSSNGLLFYELGGGSMNIWTLSTAYDLRTVTDIKWIYAWTTFSYATHLDISNNRLIKLHSVTIYEFEIGDPFIIDHYSSGSGSEYFEDTITSGSFPFEPNRLIKYTLPEYLSEGTYYYRVSTKTKSLFDQWTAPVSGTFTVVDYQTTIVLNRAEINVVANAVNINAGIKLNRAEITCTANNCQVVPGEYKVQANRVEVLVIPKNLSVYFNIMLLTAMISCIANSLTVEVGAQTIVLQRANVSISAKNLIMETGKKYGPNVQII